MSSDRRPPNDSSRPNENDTGANGQLPSAEVLNQVEAARYLHVRPRTLESWRLRRTGPRYIRYSLRCVRYRPRDLQVWLEARAVDTPSR